jgi:hypothetical protein
MSTNKICSMSFVSAGHIFLNPVGKEMEGLSTRLSEWLKPFRLSNDGNGELATHFSYAGAKYIIPDDKHKRWLQLYAHEMVTRASLFFVEKKTPVFRMHFDLDMIQPVAPTADEVLQLTTLMSAVMRTFYPVAKEEKEDKRFMCIVLSAPSMPKRGWPTPQDPEGPYVQKTGYHLIWPFLFVNQEQALRLREACIAAANNHVGVRHPPMNPFSDVIDETVLLKNGLRMIGSDKLDPCSACKGKGKMVIDGRMLPCDACLGIKTTPQRRRYTVTMVVNAKGELDRETLEFLTDHEHAVDCVRLCSIRCFKQHPSAGFTPPPLAAPCTGVEVLRREASRAARRKGGGEERELGDEQSSNGALKDAESFDAQSTLGQMVQQFLRTRMAQEWANIELKRFFFLRKHNRYLIKVRGEGSSFCCNVHRAHTSSTIYFVVEPTGCTQRCYSKKEGTATVACKKYEGPLVALPKALMDALFAPKDQKEVCPVSCVTKVAGTDLEVEPGMPVIVVPPALACLATGAPIPENAQISIARDKTVPLKQQLWGLQAAQKLAAASRARLQKEREAGLHQSAREEQKRLNDQVRQAVKKKPAPTIVGDFNSKEIDDMKAMDLVKLDRKRAEETAALVRRVREECFHGQLPPGVNEAPKKKKRRTSATMA